MKRTIIVSLVITCAACNGSHGPDPARASAEAIATVESVLTRFSSALSIGDASELDELTSDRFALLEAAVLERVDDRWQIVLMATLPETR